MHGEFKGYASKSGTRIKSEYQDYQTEKKTAGETVERLIVLFTFRDTQTNAHKYNRL